MEYVFEVQGPLADALGSQAGDFSDLILELGSRKRLPKIWKLTDWLRARPKASPETLKKRKRHQTVFGMINLLLALFAFGPALIAPKELWPLFLVGTICLGSGIASLWKRHQILLEIPLILAGLFYGIAGLGGGEEFRPLLLFGVGMIALAVVALLPRRKKQNRTAMQDVCSLLDRRHSIPQGKPIRIRFTQQGMQAFTEQGQDEIISYDAVFGILETEDLLLVVVDEQGLLLAKSELVSGAFSDFKGELSAKTLWITR